MHPGELRTLLEWRIVPVFSGGVAIIANRHQPHNEDFGDTIITTPIAEAKSGVAVTRSGSKYVLKPENRYPGEWERDLKISRPEEHRMLLDAGIFFNGENS